MTSWDLHSSVNDTTCVLELPKTTMEDSFMGRENKSLIVPEEHEDPFKLYRS